MMWREELGKVWVERKGRMSQEEDDKHEGRIMAPLIKCSLVEWTVLAGS